MLLYCIGVLNRFYIMPVGLCRDLSQGNIAILIFLATGIAGTFAFKLMSSQKVSEGGHTKYFYHPYMQTFLMSLGQLLCLIYYYANLDKYKVPLEEGKEQHKFYHFIIPSICDVSLSVLQYTALNFITGSTFRILQGGNLITTVIFSKILLKTKIFRRHWLGCSLSIAGLVIVGVSGFISPNGSSSDSVSLQILGIILMLISLVINGFGFAYEQMLMQKYTIHQYELVGWQGFFGLFLIMFLSLVFTIIPCGFTEDLCVYDQYSHLFLERVDQFFISVFNSWVLIVLSLVGIVSITFSNASGMAITKYYDALMRCLISISKTVGVWVIGLIITFSVDDKDYALQSKELSVNLVKAFGLLLTVAGTLVYNKLLFRTWLQAGEKIPANQKQQKIPILNEQQ